MEEGRSISEVRNSGCTIWRGVTVKTGPRAARQAGVMKSAARVFAPVLFTFEDGYAMPTGDANLHGNDIQAALDLLEVLWDMPVPTHPGIVPYVPTVAYHEYVMGLKSHSKLRSVANEYLRKAVLGREVGLTVHRVHGDATLENIIKIDNRVCWIDPSERIVPTVAELDIAKVLQSLMGYDTRYFGTVDDGIIQSWIYKYTRRGGLASRNLILYFYVTHLIRLWSLQPLKRDWAISTLARVEDFV
jgi:hypothetical protein